MVNCVSCGAPCTAENAQRLSFNCTYCGTFNLLGKRKAPKHNDNTLRALIDDTVRFLNQVKAGQDPLKTGSSWYSKFSSLCDEYAEKYLGEWICGKSEHEVPICTVSDTFIEAIGYYEFIRVAAILFRAYDPKESRYDNNIAKEWVHLATTGKDVPPTWRVYSDHYKRLMEKIHYAKYRGLTDLETYKVLTSVANVATKYLDSIHLYLFGSLRNAIGVSRLETDSVYRMAGIETVNRFYFISLLIPASEQNVVGAEEKKEIKGLAKALVSDSVLLTSINHIGYNRLKYYIAQSAQNYIGYVCEREPKEKRTLTFLDELEILIPVPTYDMDKVKGGSVVNKKSAPTAYWVIASIPFWILLGLNQHLWAAVAFFLACLLSLCFRY